jgi:hypothetical protein
MPLDLDDGYTLPFETKPTVSDVAGRPVYDDLPVVTGRYRPATWEELQGFRYRYGRAASGSEEVAIVAEMIADHLAAWDVRAGGQPLKIFSDNVRRLPEPIANQLLDIVTRWAPKQADAEKNSAGGSASGSRNPGGG